jgi:hypothetical protein
VQDTVIVGEAVAGEAASVRKAIVKLIRQVDSNTFDIAELFHRAKAKRLYTEPTFAEYAATFNIKKRRAQYLERIVDVMEQINCPRTQYEPIGISKLRVITRLKAVNDDGTQAMYTNTVTQETYPVADFLWGFVEQAQDMKLEKIEEDVRVILGETGENDMTWLNIRLPRIVRDGTVKAAFEKAAINIGTVATDDEGVAKEVQDWRKLEVVCVEYVNDKSTDPEVV